MRASTARYAPTCWTRGDQPEGYKEAFGAEMVVEINSWNWLSVSTIAFATDDAEFAVTLFAEDG